MTRRAIALGVVVLFIGTWAGLARAGLVLPHPAFASMHGPLMVGFFATVVSVERATSRGRAWFVVPVAAALGPLSEAFGAPHRLAAGMALLAALGLALMSLRSGSLSGACALAFGASGWLLQRPTADIALAWAAFLMLTIGTERLEARSPRARTVFRAIGLLVAVGAIAVLFGERRGERLFGVGAFAFGVWLLFERRRAESGFPQIARASVLAGATWLVVAGGLVVHFGLTLAYDAVLHCVFLGFAFSVVFGHGPGLIRTLAGISLRFGRRFWAPLDLLHVSVASRILGDVAGSPDLRLGGALGNAAALALFLGVMAVSIARLNRRMGYVVKVE